MNQEKMGLFISKLRKEYKLTQKELADKLGILDTSISKWERGINAPDISYLTELSKIFHVTVQELLSGERNFKKKEIDVNHHSKVLEVANLSKSFGKRKILDNINLTIYEGDIIGLIGPNGAGKTTLIKTILRLYYYDKGSVKICGYDTKKQLEQALSKVGSIIEKPDMYDQLTGRKNLKITELLNDLHDQKYVEEIIEFVGLKTRINDKVKKYSLGMKQRLAIANALIKKPKLLILDEPTNGLDPKGIRELRQMLKTISQEQNMSILISSHILSEVENICDRVVIIDQGRLVKEFGIEEVKYKNISLEEEYFSETESFENGEEHENN
ncbi:MAG TPA: XRE family transcriptional regulator [Candidatus Scybalousia intestinigallinarum]|jgi:ABC-2 type transport system ATP-binding protein|nr:XRE family transcriptional regulator [Candidatus Scybalousia intestinigallinarum]